MNIDEDTVWLTIEQMCVLFEKSRATINEHILNIFKEKELEKEEVVRKIGNSDFSQNVTKPTNYYSLDVIISVGYRVKSQRGTQFRRWATSVLRDYLLKGASVQHPASIAVTSCAVLTPSQLQMVTNLTVASDSVAVTPKVIFNELAAIRSLRIWKRKLPS
jgi:hypothetical protein